MMDTGSDILRENFSVRGLFWLSVVVIATIYSPWSGRTTLILSGMPAPSLIVEKPFGHDMVRLCPIISLPHLGVVAEPSSTMPLCPSWSPSFTFLVLSIFCPLA